jgi:DNA-binding transcriptional ArsR family regulator
MAAAPGAGRIDDEMAAPHPLPDDLVELIAERFRALSEPTRVKLLDQLREGEATVLELTERIGTTQQNVSKHLGVLQRSGIVARRKQGNFAYYRIADEGVFALCEAVCGSLSRRADSLHELVAASSVTRVSRELNADADKLANRGIDEAVGKGAWPSQRQ